VVHSGGLLPCMAIDHPKLCTSISFSSLLQFCFFVLILFDFSANYNGCVPWPLVVTPFSTDFSLFCDASFSWMLVFCSPTPHRRPTLRLLTACPRGFSSPLSLYTPLVSTLFCKIRLVSPTFFLSFFLISSASFRRHFPRKETFTPSVPQVPPGGSGGRALGCSLRLTFAQEFFCSPWFGVTFLFFFVIFSASLRGTSLGGWGGSYSFQFSFLSLLSSADLSDLRSPPPLFFCCCPPIVRSISYFFFRGEHKGETREESLRSTFPSVSLFPRHVLALRVGLLGVLDCVSFVFGFLSFYSLLSHGGQQKRCSFFVFGAIQTLLDGCVFVPVFHVLFQERCLLPHPVTVPLNR